MGSLRVISRGTPELQIECLLYHSSLVPERSNSAYILLLLCLKLRVGHESQTNNQTLHLEKKLLESEAQSLYSLTYVVNEMEILTYLRKIDETSQSANSYTVT